MGDLKKKKESVQHLCYNISLLTGTFFLHLNKNITRVTTHPYTPDPRVIRACTSQSSSEDVPLTQMPNSFVKGVLRIAKANRCVRVIKGPNDNFERPSKVKILSISLKPLLLKLRVQFPKPRTIIGANCALL